MQINRQNYEQYFLLYADGELTTSERNAVQQFVAENKDLAIELEMIQATILPKEDITLFDKNFLYKGVDYKTKQKLLLKIDNELPAIELAEIDGLLSSDINVKAEYDLLSNTVLDKNEKIIFEDKHLLYRKEKDNVVVFGYLRWAAAAMFIGFALFTGIKFFNDKSNIEQAVAITNDSKKQEDTSSIKSNIPNENIALQNNTVQNNDAIISTNKDNVASKNIETVDNNFALKTQNIVKDKKSVTNNNTERITNNLHENIVNNKENNFITKQEIIIPEVIKEAVVENNVAVAKTNSSEKALNTERLYELENTYTYQNAALIEEDKTENKILYMNESKVKKSKVGMFFSKMKTAVQKTANVKPGNSIQIAGFEISGH